jgi:hypothetical protein
MKQIPFLAFPVREQDALYVALRNAGVAPRKVCVSRVELADPEVAGAFATVTTPLWCRTYECSTDRNWIAVLEHELAAAAA